MNKYKTVEIIIAYKSISSFKTYDSLGYKLFSET